MFYSGWGVPEREIERERERARESGRVLVNRTVKGCVSSF